MRYQNTVFHDMLKGVPWAVLERLVEEYRADYRVRKLTTKSQVVALLYGQLSGATSLRAVTTGLESHRARLYHVGAKPAARSTLADANASRPSELFGALLAVMMKQAHRGLRRKMAEATYLIDATSVRLNGLSDWAWFSTGVFGAKVHVIYDPNADRPVYSVVTTAKVNDITAAQAMPIEPGATYVFDLGYYDFGWWARLDEAACRIVTRLKVNTRLAVIEERPLPLEPGAILSDRIGFLPERQARSRQNPMVQAVREVRVSTESGTVLRLLTNDLDAPAEEIAALYRRRWAIELFFRWVKQMLRIGHFYATSESAVAIQVTVALIAFVLLKLAHAAQGAVESLTQFARLVGAMLMQQTSIDSLRGQHAMLLVPPVQLHAQGVLPWA
jgi:IS4 transposase